MALYNAANLANFREYADHASFDVTTAISVSVWIKPQAATITALGGAVGRGDNSVDGHWSLGNTSTPDPNDKFRFAMRTSAGQGNAVDTVAWTNGAWHHLVGWWDGTNVRLYRGGTQAATAAFGGTAAAVAVAIRLFERTSGANLFNGHLAELGIWNVALTVDEIAALADGVPPLLIRPASRIIYDPLFVNSRDVIKGLGANTGTLTDQPHPKVIRKPHQEIGFPVTALALSGWEPAGPITISPRGRGAVSWDGPLRAFQAPGGWEPPAPRTVSPRGKIGSNWDGPRLATLAATGWEPLGPQTTSPRGNPGISFDASLLFAALARSGWEPGAAAVHRPRAPAPGMDTPGPGFVAPLLSTGWEPPPPAPRAPARPQVSSWDGPLLAFLRTSGWEPPGPQTVSPRGRGAVNWDGPLVPFLAPDGWEPGSPIARQLRRLFPDAPPPLQAFLLASGWEPPSPRTQSPRGKGPVNYDGAGLLAALAAGGWYPASPSLAAPRGKQGVNWDGGGILAALGLSGWEPPGPRTRSPVGKPGPNFDGAGLLAALGLAGWDAASPFARQLRQRWPVTNTPLSAFVTPLSPSGWEPPGPRTLTPHAAPGANFYGWPAFPLRSGGFEPPGPRTQSPRGKLAPSFDGPMVAIVSLVPAGWEPATPRPRGSRSGQGVNADAGILIPPRLVTGWEPAAPYLPRAPRPGVGWNHDGPWLALLRAAGWEPPGPETTSPRGKGAVNFDGPFIPFLLPQGWEDSPAIVRQLHAAWVASDVPLIAFAPGPDNSPTMNTINGPWRVEVEASARGPRIVLIPLSRGKVKPG